MTIETRPRTAPGAVSLADRIAGLRAIDTDVHNDLPSYAELKPYLARGWHPWLEDVRPRFALQAYANPVLELMDDAVRYLAVLAPALPELVMQQLLVKYHIDI